MVFGREPVAIAAFIAIAVNLVVSFGLNLTVEQISLINALVVAGLALIARSQTTPTADPMVPIGTQVRTPGHEPAGVVVPAGSPEAADALNVAPR
jgi:hypothetical protein